MKSRIIFIKKFCFMKKINQNWDNIKIFGQCPPPLFIVQNERKLDFKRDSLVKLEKSAKIWSINGNSCRTDGINFSSGVPDWYLWCSCKNKCGTQWSYKWLLHLKMIRINQSTLRKEISLKEMIIKIGVIK